MKRLSILVLLLVAMAALGWAQPTINTNSPLPSGTVGFSYQTTIQASGGFPFSCGGNPCYNWSIAVGGGNLPPGLGIGSMTGIISGSPTQSGSFLFTVQAQDMQGLVGSKQFQLIINASGGQPPITNPPGPNPGVITNGTIGRFYTFQFQASGGVPFQPGSYYI